MRRIGIINGPNLNLLGKREPQIYGTMSFEEYLPVLRRSFPTVEISYFQSNSEGAIIDMIQQWGETMNGIVLNAAAYTHTSIAIRDAVSAIQTPVIEVHISDITRREPFRRFSYLTDVCQATVMGKGLEGYKEAIELLQ